jgi:hypothetical protein
MSARDLIQLKISEVLASDEPGLKWLRQGVRQHGFLPLYLGWLEVTGIRPDGTFVRWPSEEAPDVILDLVEPYWQRMALVEGSKRYSGFDVLLPTRPHGAVSCQRCGGLGHPPGHPHLVCSCGGVGWHVQGECYSPSPR